MNIRQWIVISFLLIFSLTQTGCASWGKKIKSFLGGGPSATEQEKKPATALTKFSENPDVSPRVRRQYKRTTKESLADESALDSKAGSLWVMEGQGAYLFSQNIVRLVGDPLAITLEGDPRDQLTSKATVIKKLLAKIEERQKARLRAPAGADGAAKDDSAGGENADDKNAANKKDKSTTANNSSANQNGVSQTPEEKAAELSVKTVPTRIVERTLEGNYRVKGTQPFMIGSREYKIIVTGIVRAEDFNEEGMSATKLLDPKFDIVSARKTETQL